MSMNERTYQTVPITCPSCQNRFVSPVLTTIDVGQSPEAKTLFLSGQLNVAVCPQCGHAGVLSTPLVYHDPDKELLFTYLPSELGVPEDEQQRLIGDLTNRVIAALPAEKRKGYLLRPRSFFRLEAMMEAILEADGVTPEMLEQQRAKAALLDRLLRATSEEARRVIAQENDGQIDYGFFQFLTLNIELAQAGEDTDTVNSLLALRSQLLQWTTDGRKVAEREDAVRSLGQEITREGLLEKLVEAAFAGEQTKVETMVSIARPAIDYIFYQQLTARLDAADEAGRSDQAQTLRVLRETILDLTEQIDAEVAAATEEAAQFLAEVLESEDPEARLGENPDRVDELFMSVLATLIKSAERAGNAETVEQLSAVSSAVVKLIQESQPPEIRLISQLLTADYPDGTREILEAHREQVTPELLEVMKLVAEDLNGDRKEASERLERVREQAAAMVG